MREKNVPEQLSMVPTKEEREAAIPIATRQVDHSSYAIERLRESVTAMELDHHNFPDPYSAAEHAYNAHRWEKLPINRNHSSHRHDFNGRLFENFREAVSGL